MYESVMVVWGVFHSSSKSSNYYILMAQDLGHQASTIKASDMLDLDGFNTHKHAVS